MGLSVISTIAVPVSTTAPGLASEATGAQSGGFAALLSGQTLAGLLAPAASSPGVPGTASLASEEKGSGDTLDTDTTTSSMDPAALVALLGNPQIQPTITPRTTIGQEQQPIKESREQGAGLASTLLGSGSRNDTQHEPSLGTSLTTLGERPTGGPLAATEQPQRADAANIAAPGEQSNRPVTSRRASPHRCTARRGRSSSAKNWSGWRRTISKQRRSTSTRRNSARCRSP
jgi:hypothetical protein